MQITEQYLTRLESDSERLLSCLPPEVRRSRRYDLKEPDQRIQFATMVSRVGIESLYQYDRHRGNGTGLVRRLRGEIPFKLSESRDSAEKR